VADHQRSETLAEGPLLRPEHLTAFRLGQLLLLLDIARLRGKSRPIDIERIGYYDFFAANPFLVFGADANSARDLVLAGFDSRSFSYHSSAQRFSNRRARLQHDLAFLIAYGLLTARAEGKRVRYELTEAGESAARGFESLYARAYRTSAEMVVRRLGSLTDTRLRNEAKRWLRAEAFMIDLYDVAEPA
jgi:hypothetical protein